MRGNAETLAAVEREYLLNTKDLFAILKNRIKFRNKDPCYGLRLMCLRI